MPTLAIMNYEQSVIEMIELSDDIVKQYAEDYDKLVFNYMGYKETTVYYMIADKIDVIRKKITD